MLRTRVGYCGGDKAKPTYYAMGDHTEAITIDYDPKVLSYDDLLKHFWKGHRCNQVNSSIQYMNAVFYRDEDQKKLAEASLAKQAARRGIPRDSVETKIVPMKQFTYAEGYHQKYYLTRFRDVRNFLEQTYPDAKSLSDSTVATRLNAYLGSGVDRDWKQLITELPKYDLPEEIESVLKKAAETKLK